MKKLIIIILLTFVITFGFRTTVNAAQVSIEDGDLQTYAADLSINNVDTNLIQNEVDSWSIYSNQNEDFCSLAGLSNCSFNEMDMLADLDAMNIMQLLVNGLPSTASGIYVVPNNYNSISNALTGYYFTVNEDNSYYANRYKMFLTAVNTRDGSIENDNLYDGLRERIYESMYIKVVNGEYASKTIYFGTYTTRLYYLNVNNEIVLASLDSRVIAAKLFNEYITYMASRPYYS